ncbi:hypothetical protein [Fibrobacter sp. UWB11]|uniref:hypothetical protein n=1 Tax=Fibrobacter sp. UWB11 TaxID=1896202 RepID=UPI00092C66D5|nr:hypothetical protein [Fibrobacter sp. UWB11]SIN82335.1 hypothetical protein SAMN05720758_0077 [Fibrobacter sp. UWB11]
MSRTHSVIVEILIYKNLILNSRNSATKKGNELEGDIDIEGDFFRPDLNSGKNKKLFCQFVTLSKNADFRNFSPPPARTCSVLHAFRRHRADILTARSKEALAAFCTANKSETTGTAASACELQGQSSEAPPFLYLLRRKERTDAEFRTNFWTVVILEKRQ